MIGQSLIHRVQTLVVNADDYLQEKKTENKKKQKWFRRRDIAIWSIILLISVLLFAIPHTSTPAVNTSNHTDTQTSTPAISTSNHPGKGGVDTTHCVALGPPNICYQPPVTVSPNDIIDNWDNTGNTVTSNTYNQPAGTYADPADNGDFLIDPRVGSLFYTKPDLTVDNPDIRTLWYTFTRIVSFFLVLAVIFTGYKMVFGGGGFRYAEAVESLPRALLAGIAAFMSIVFIALVFTVSNGLNQMIMDYMYNAQNIKIHDIILPVSQWENYITILITNIAQLFQGNVSGGIPIIGGLFTIAANLDSIGPLVENLRNFIWLLLTLMLASQVVLRLATLNLYIVTSPLAFICGAFPSQQGQQVVRTWAAGFFTTLFVQFVQILAMYVGWILFKDVHVLGGVSVYTTEYHPGIFGLGAGNNVTTYIDNLAPLVTLWFMLRVPRLFNSSAMQSITSAGQVLTGAMRSAVGVAGI